MKGFLSVAICRDKLMAIVMMLLVVSFNPIITQNANAADNKKVEKKTKYPKKSKQKMGYKLPTEAHLLVESESGKVLHSKNADERIYPASTTKIMTLYLIFDALEENKLKLNQEIKVSRKAASMKPCKLWLKPGEKINVKDAIVAMIVKSANDVSVAMAEAVAGSEQKFVERMNKKAKELGMSNTNFKNSSGWYHREQKTTAVDLVKLAMAVKRDFPEYYPFFSTKSFKFRGHVIMSHNKMIRKYKGAEGMKTGFTSPSGFNLVSVATREDKTLIGVVTGGRLATECDKKMISMMNKHFGVSNTKVASNTKIASNKKSNGRKAQKSVANSTRVDRKVL